MTSKEKIQNTIDYLRKRQVARANGYPVSFTDDPTWLVDMAINRRAGWPDDPSTCRGSCMPVNGKYPIKASGDFHYRAIQHLARKVNTPRLIVGVTECPKHLRQRLSHRFYSDY